MPTTPDASQARPDTKRWIVKSHKPEDVKEVHGHVGLDGFFYPRGFYQCPPWAAVKPDDHYATREDAIARAKELRDERVNELTKELSRLAGLDYEEQVP